MATNRLATVLRYLPRARELPKCRVCRKPPEGFNWLVESQRNRKELVHIYGDCKAKDNL